MKAFYKKSIKSILTYSLNILLLLIFSTTMVYADKENIEATLPKYFSSLDIPLPNTEFNDSKSTIDIELPLSKLMADTKPRNLNGMDASINFGLPYDGLWEAEEITLKLNGITSKSLIDTSQLLISVNDHIIHQEKLGTADEKFTFSIKIPVEYLTHGFNRVQIRAIQHYADVCEVTLSPQLWTQINLVKSKILIRAYPRLMKPSLNLLPKLFDSATWQATPTVPIFMASTPTNDQIGALNFVAQGIGHRYSFVPVRLLKLDLPKSAEELDALMPKTSRSALVLATFDTIKPFLKEFDIPTNQGPIIAVKTLPNNSARYVVYILGKNTQEINQAASAFAILGIPWPENSWASISEINIPTPTELEQRFSLPSAGNGAFPLRALGYKNQTLNGIDANSIKLKIWENTWQGRMQVRVHLAYANGMSNQSAVNIIANGVMHGSIPLNDIKGGAYEGYAVTIPAGTLKPGWNVLEFQPKMIPANSGGKCQPFFSDNLALTIYEDTTIQKFGGSELKEIDLSTISGAGFIFTEKPLGKDVAFHLASNDADTISAAMTLVAKLSQIYHRPLLNSSFSFSNNTEELGNFHYWIGSYKHLPKKLQKDLNVKIPQSFNISVPLTQSATLQVHENTEWIIDLLEKFNISSAPPKNYTMATMKVSGEFSGNSFALSTRNKNNEPTLVFTASDTKALLAGINSVVDFGQWSQLRGLLAFWLPTKQYVNAVSVEDEPFSAYGLRGGLGLWVSQYPWTSLFILFSFTGLLVLMTRRVMKQYKRRHQQHEN